MKSTGIIRQLDELGRIVLPMEIRKSFDIQKRNPVEIYVENDMIILKKHTQSCTFCDSTENIKEFKTKHICETCLKDISK